MFHSVALATALAVALAVVLVTVAASAADRPPVGGGGGRGGAAGAVRIDYAPVNGLRLYYEDHNPGAGGVPLVLLHGGGSTIETSFGKVLPLLAKSRRVIAFEQQGHGHTADVTGRPFTFEQSADDTAALLAYLKVERADLFGYSNGASIALYTALRHPAVVRRLVIQSTFVNHAGAVPGFWEGFPKATLNSMPPELQEAYRKTAPHPENLQSFFEKSVQRMMDFRDMPADRLRSITAPTLIMIGDHDIVRPEHAVELTHVFPRASLAVLPETNHMNVADRAGWIAPMVDTFLDAPDPAPAR